VTNYKSFADRIRNSKTETEVNKFIDKAAQFQQLGLITDNQFMRLDSLGVDKIIAIEEINS